VIDWSPAAGPVAAAVLLHPHPDMGGDRFNHVVDSLYRGLPAAGISAARFDFSSSDPVIAAGETGEAFAEVSARAAGVPAFLVGYSFGADIATTIGEPAVAGWVLVAPPLRIVTPAAMVIAADPRPKLLLVPEHDQFDPPERARGLSGNWTAATVAEIPGADHFLAGAAGAVVTAAAAWVTGLVSAGD
jgi:alpha/beta superfamily hydrolase